MIASSRYSKECGKTKPNGYVSINPGFIKSAICNMTIDIQYRIIGKLLSDEQITDDTYKDNHLYQPIFSRSYNEISKELIVRFKSIQKDYGNARSDKLIEHYSNFLKKLIQSNDIDYINNHLKLCLIKVNKFLGFLDNNINGYSWFLNRKNKSLLFVGLSGVLDKNLNFNYPKLTNNQFIKTNSLLSEKIRHEYRKPTFNEYLSLYIAFEMISLRGYTESPIVPWGNSGFREIQAQASITDSGLGHITGTATKQKFIKGTNVHVEFLERGKITDREKVEPYRLPDLETIGKVKMLIGKDTSVSSYVGRPMFEDTFDNSFIKSSHTMIAACSSIFMNGLSECKIAIEKMSYMQSVKFMQAISANVVRDQKLQVLAAAFCINYPILDDRPETIRNNNGKPVLVKDAMQIAKLGIQIAKDGNFEKVTFDGTANWYPSDPIMEQLGYKNALELVHIAHKQGLLTYFSAGFRFRHLADIVLSGTDGIGLGGSQILRFMDKSNGNQGPFKENNISTILDINKKTECSILGQGTKLLCRLDRMYYELSLPSKFVNVKEELYKALRNKQENAVNKILETSKEIVNMRIDLAHPIIEWANRLIENKDNCLAFDKMSDEKKDQYIAELSDGILSHDYNQLGYIMGNIKLNND
ncbi:hypothetical protein DY052_06225 [Apilactobacillus timberlakei]|uniref:hypothetical protein n=1 Tax=Apilactobacillus timberlakei TaxID=2008380 RepID=UPI0011281534|nr:hypothetical protein [Apilactobacillus timberlakei]TPR15020.1 hypothetical protein DY052_06225 [Apilactobacillus timberlakei]